MKHYLLLLLCCIFISISLTAQLPGKDLQTNTKGVHWIERKWYKPLPGSEKPDTGKAADISLPANQLIEYNKNGNLMASMDFERGTYDVSGPTMRYYWDGGTRLKKEVFENEKYEAVYTTSYSYDAAGKEIKIETQRGPGDRMGITANEYTESTWTGGRLAKETYRDEKGALQKEITYTYNTAGLKTREDYYPVFLYSAKTFTYDDKGNMLTETRLDKAGKLSYILSYEYNSRGKLAKNSSVSYYNGVKQVDETEAYTYDAYGGCINKLITKGGKTVSNYSWKHTYDAKGSRVQTVHVQDGKTISVEVLELRYYK
jgi:hypothetical protein